MTEAGLHAVAHAGTVACIVLCILAGLAYPLARWMDHQDK